MDPFSLATGVLTLLGACTTASATISKFRRLKEAPGLIQALSNEISDLRLVLLDVSDHFRSTQSAGLVIPDIDRTICELSSSVLDQARVKVQEVEAVIQYEVTKPGRGADLKVDKTAFLRNYSRLLLLQADLRDTRQKMTSLFNHMGVRNFSRIEVLLNEIQANDIPELLQGQRRIESALNRLVDLQSPISTVGNEAFQPVITTRREGSDLSSISVSVSRLRPPGKQRMCTCSRRSASGRVGTLFGTLFVGYMATPIACQCDQGGHRFNEMDLTLTYIFPSWFLRYAMSIQAKINTGGTIQCSLTIKQTIPFDHVIWDMIEVEDIPGMKRLLTSGQISIKAESSGSITVPLLHQAIVLGSIRSVKFLIDMGADVHWDLNDRGSPQKVVWSKILSNEWSIDFQHRMMTLFPNPDFDELYEFSQLHKVVLGLDSHTIKESITAEPAQVNKADKSGNTALSWAVRRGDSETVRALLSYEPDYNDAQDRIGYKPLDYAVKASLECTKLLLQAKPNTGLGNNGLWTPLHQAMRSSMPEYALPESETIQIVELLIQRGVDVNAVNWAGNTALSIARQPGVASCLLKHGADPGILARGGENALSRAVCRNQHGLVDLYIRGGQGHSSKMDQYGTFMHLAASYADVKTLQLLAQGGLERRDINVKNYSGLTPVQVAMQRKNVDDEWWASVMSFLRSIDEDQPPVEPSEIPPTSSRAAHRDSASEATDSEAEYDEAFEFQP